VPGLDPDRLAGAASAQSTVDAVRRDHAKTRAPCAFPATGAGPHPGQPKELDDGVCRFALPTLLFDGPGGRVVVPGRHPLDDYLTAAGTAAEAARP
jgi:hypothetical protein